MSSRNASRLDPGLIARKGQAAPAAPVPAPAASELPASLAAVPPPPAPANGPAPGEEARAPAARGLQGTIAVTLRLDPARYERLKVHGARARRTNQEILVEALDDYFRNKA
jgi:hypothetical protein